MSILSHFLGHVRYIMPISIIISGGIDVHICRKSQTNLIQ